VGRSHVEFVNAAELPLELIVEGPLAGASRRLLSRDEGTGASTSLLTLPAGWRGELDPERPHELFVLRGQIELGPRTLGQAFYSYVPSGTADATITASEATLALLMADASRPPTAAPIEVIDTTKLSWTNSPLKTPPGIARKPLHTDPETGDNTWLSGVVPGWRAEQVERHPTVEEVFALRGDMFLGPPGEMTAGCYFWRPPLIKHGPMVTRNGFFAFSRSHEGALEVEWWDEEGAPEMLDAHLAREPVGDLPLLY
jgi:hypothetical protein